MPSSRLRSVARDGLQQCRSHTVLLEDAQAGGRRATGRGDHGTQLRRVAALGEQRRRADEQLRHERLGDRAGEAGEHAGVDQRLGDEEHVGRPAAGETGDGVEL